MGKEIDPKLIRTLKRNQLIRSFESVVREYPDALSMGREQAVDHLLSLEDDGKILIRFEAANDCLLCKIDWLS
jgi:hypothetical protein